MLDKLLDYFISEKRNNQKEKRTFELFTTQGHIKDITYDQSEETHSISL